MNADNTPAASTSSDEIFWSLGKSGATAAGVRGVRPDDPWDVARATGPRSAGIPVSRGVEPEIVPPSGEREGVARGVVTFEGVSIRNARQRGRPQRHDECRNTCRRLPLATGPRSSGTTVPRGVLAEFVAASGEREGGACRVRMPPAAPPPAVAV